MTLTVQCPSCRAEVIWSEASKFRPFCSLRCQQLDFCSWATESHVIPGDSPFDDVFSEDIARSQSEFDDD
jgi:endogenous inhibitor of DNA gyrase (YacG/DUF329 family)